MRKHNFVVGEYYHIYNRGTDKRNIILDKYDLDRFLQSIVDFNTLNPIGSIYEFSFQKKKFGSLTSKSKLVSIIAFCVNQNHFHFILTPLTDKGIERFMQRIGGYTKYFNEKYKRSGVLFQGKFKSKHISSNEYLLHLSAYINMNNQNLFRNSTPKLSKSSLDEYTKNIKSLCNTEIVLGQFKNQAEYLDFAIKSWHDTNTRKIALEIE